MSNRPTWLAECNASGPIFGCPALRAVCLCVFASRLVTAYPLYATTRPPSSQPAEAGYLQLDDPPEPFRRPALASDAQCDRAEALALFATGRAYDNRGEDVLGLRFYERAYRCDPTAEPILTAIVDLACELKRLDEAARYALKSKQTDDVDPLLLRRLGLCLSEQGDWKGALKLYQRVAVIRGPQENAFDVVMHMEMGRLCELVEDYGKATECFDFVLRALDQPERFGVDDKVRAKLLSEPSTTYNLIGECYLLADRPRDAQSAFEKARDLATAKISERATTKNGPDETTKAQSLAQIQAEFDCNRARLLLRTGKPDESLAVLEKCLTARPSELGTLPYEELAKVLDKLGKGGELIERLEKLHADDSKNAALAYCLAEQYRKAGRPEKAEPLFRRALISTPTLDAYGHLSTLLRQEKKYDALLTLLGEAVARAGLLETLGDEATAITKDPEVIAGLTQVARQKLRDHPAELRFGERLAVAAVALEGKQFATAAEFSDAALKCQDGRPADVIMIWGAGLLVNQRYAEASAVYQRGIDEKALPSDNPLFYFYLATSKSLEGKHEEALAAARRAAALKPDSAHFRSRIAWVYYQAKRYDDALAAYRELLAKFGNRFSDQQTRDVLREARSAMSNICVLQGNMAEAEEWLEQVLDEFPDDTGALNDLGYLWADEGKHLQRALRMVQAAVSAEPDNPAYRDSLGWALHRGGREAEAAVELQKAAEVQPDGEILEHLAEVYAKQQQRDDARQAYRRAADAYQKEKETDKAKAVQKKLEELKR